MDASSVGVNNASAPEVPSNPGSAASSSDSRSAANDHTAKKRKRTKPAAPARNKPAKTPTDKCPVVFDAFEIIDPSRRDVAASMTVCSREDVRQDMVRFGREQHNALKKAQCFQVTGKTKSLTQAVLDHFLSDDLIGVLLKSTNENLKMAQLQDSRLRRVRPFTTAEILQAIAEYYANGCKCWLKAVLSGTSDGRIWPLPALNRDLLSRARFKMLSRFFSGWVVDKTTNVCDYDRPSGIEANSFVALVNQRLLPLRRAARNSPLVVDDDLMRTTSKGSRKFNLPKTLIDGKGVGVKFDLTTSTATLLPIEVHLRHSQWSAQDSMLSFLRDKSLRTSRLVLCADREYTTGVYLSIVAQYHVQLVSTIKAEAARWLNKQQGIFVKTDGTAFPAEYHGRRERERRLTERVDANADEGDDDDDDEGDLQPKKKKKKKKKKKRQNGTTATKRTPAAPHTPDRTPKKVFPATTGPLVVESRGAPVAYHLKPAALPVKATGVTERKAKEYAKALRFTTVRHNQRTVKILSRTFPAEQHLHRLVFEKRSPQPKRVVYTTEDEWEVLRSSDVLSELRSRSDLVEVTQGQADTAWFAARVGRVTSTVASAVLSGLGSNKLNSGGAVLSMLLKKWHLKKPTSKMRTLFHRGHVGEGLAKDELPRFLEQHAGGVQVLRIEERGLLVRESESFLGSSVDGLVVIRGLRPDESADGHPRGKDEVDEDAEADGLFPAILEVKTATTAHTDEEAAELANEYGCFRRCKYGDDVFQHLVPANYRVQLLHHAAIVGTDHVLYVRRGLRQLHYAVLASTSEAERAAHRALLCRHLEPLLAWVDALAEPSDEFRAALEEVLTDPALAQSSSSPLGSYWRDTHTVYYNLRVSGALHRYASSCEGLVGVPPVHDLKIEQQVRWNQFKAGTDSISAVLSNSAPDFKMSAATKVTVRCIRLLMLAAHKTEALISWQPGNDDEDEGDEEMDEMDERSTQTKRRARTLRSMRRRIQRAVPFLQFSRRAFAHLQDRARSDIRYGVIVESPARLGRATATTPAHPGPHAETAAATPDWALLDEMFGTKLRTSKTGTRRFVPDGGWLAAYNTTLKRVRLTGAVHEHVPVSSRSSHCVMCTSTAPAPRSENDGATYAERKNKRQPRGCKTSFRCKRCHVPLCIKGLRDASGTVQEACWVVFHRDDVLKKRPYVGLSDFREAVRQREAARPESVCSDTNGLAGLRGSSYSSASSTSSASTTPSSPPVTPTPVNLEAAFARAASSSDLHLSSSATATSRLGATSTTCANAGLVRASSNATPPAGPRFHDEITSRYAFLNRGHLDRLSVMLSKLRANTPVRSS